jgi:oxygen-dependent protoporphyrinogen oxidase
MPAPEAGAVLAASGFSRQAEALKGVHYNPMAMAHMAFSKQSEKEFAGFGGLVPAAAGFRSAGAIWTSSLFEGRQPKEQHLLTAFYGGALRPEAAGKTKEEIEAVLQEENQILYGRKADFFPHTEIWQQGIPQYDAGRRQAEEMVDAMKTEGVFFLANWKGGIGLSDCIRNAAMLAKNLTEGN